MPRGPNDPVLWGSDGKPLSLEGALLAPAALNVAQIIMNYGKMHSLRWDEAMRNAPENALAMRRNTFYLSLLQERTAPTINLEWQVEVDDEDDPIQKLDAEICNRGWREVPDKPGLMSWIIPATIWFGRAGQQGKWRPTGSGLTNWTFHEPVHGDSIQHQWDRTPVILTSFYTANRIRTVDPDAIINATDRGAYGLRLYKPEYRQRFILHAHVREAADYFEGEMSGGVNGVGLRSWCYWQGFIRDDALAAMTGFVSSTGMMDLMVFNYPMGDVAAQRQAETNAKTIQGKIALVCPRDPSKDWPAIEQYPMNDSGVECMKGLIEDCYDRYTRELFVGQNMSNGGGGPGGLEGDGRAELAGDTKFQLCKTDALRLGDTLTRDWLIPFRNFNRPGSTTPMRMKPVLQDPKQEQKAQNITVAVQSGIEIEMDEAREVLGFKKPRPGKPTIGSKPAGDQLPGMPGKPPGPNGAVAQPPAKEPSKAGDFLNHALADRLERLENLILYRAAQPPWPGAQFNEQTHRWENPNGTVTAQGGRATTSKPDEPEGKTALREDVKASIEQGIDRDFEGQQIEPSLLAKAKDVALTVAAKAYVWAMHATHSKAAGHLATVLEAVFDTPSDMAKFGYNPNTTSGTANPQNADPVKAATGISGHLVASIASKVLVKAAGWIAGKLKTKPHGLSPYDSLGDEHDGYGEWADLIATVFANVHQQLGIAGQTPDAATVEQNLRTVIKAHEDKFTGYDRAPIGGVDVGGTHYPGGQFIPKEVVAKATAAEKRAIKTGLASTPTVAKAKTVGVGGRKSDSKKSDTNRKRVDARPESKSVKKAGQVIDIARSRRIKAAHKREQEVADAIGGYNLLDSEPADVAYVPAVDGKGNRTGEPVKFRDQRELRKYMANRAKAVERMKDESTSEHEREFIRKMLEETQPLIFFEVKTLLTSHKDEIRMNPDALAAKERWQEKYHAKFNVVIIDDRKGKKHSGHRIHMQPADEMVNKVHKLAHSRKVDKMADVLKHATEKPE